MAIRNGHVRWAFDLKSWCYSMHDLELATACIQSEEKERLAQFVYRDDFNASLIGRLLMRRFVKSCMPDIEYNSIKFERDAHGKPYLRPERGNISPDKQRHTAHIDFNVSHHERYAVLAGTYASNQAVDNLTETAVQRIGVDVMRTQYSGGKSLNEFFRIMYRNFTPNEWQTIKMDPAEHKQAQSFMRHWCLKESYVKNIGVGITINLQSIDFRLNTSDLRMDRILRDSQCSVDGKLLHNWIFEESLLDGDHCVAVAIENPMENYRNRCADELRFEMIDFQTLMQGAQPLLDIDTEYCRRIFAKEYKRRL